MKRTAALALVWLAGCSTAPVADLFDYFAPGQMSKGDTAPYGGVCIPQGGPIVPAVPPMIAPPPPGVPLLTPLSQPPPGNAVFSGPNATTSNGKEAPAPVSIHITPLNPQAGESFNPAPPPPPSMLPGRQL